MEQLLLHLFGDYITQSDWMAQNKTKHVWPALIHGIVYSIPFLLLGISGMAWFVICSTHIVIDHFRLARYVVFAKNWINTPGLKWADCSGTGYHKGTPTWLAFWLLIIADNTMHLAINFAAIRWIG